MPCVNERAFKAACGGELRPPQRQQLRGTLKPSFELRQMAMARAERCPWRYAFSASIILARSECDGFTRRRSTKTPIAADDHRPAFEEIERTARRVMAHAPYHGGY